MSSPDAPEPASSQRSATLTQLPMSEVVPNEENPRLIFPQEEIDRLADSIDLEGILVPVVVFPRGDKYVLVDGERRYRCAEILGHSTIPAVVTSERSEHDVLLQMFNIHLIREPWQDMPTAKALKRLIDTLNDRGEDSSDATLRNITGLSIERVRQLRYVTSLPGEWQDHIESGRIPLNFFWEMKRNVIDPMKNNRPALFEELGENGIGQSLVEKRLNGVITDTVSLRNARPVINFAAQEAQEENDETAGQLDNQIRSMVNDPNVSVNEVYEDTVQSMVEADKLEKRTSSMVASFSRLLIKARTPEEQTEIVRIGENLILQIQRLVAKGDNRED